MSSAQGGADFGHSVAPGRETPPMLAAAFAAGGEMGGRLSRFDWSTGPLGEPGRWPTALSNAVGMMLASSAQIVMFWGDEQLAFYNDAYRPTIGSKHPEVLGQPARQHWAETWAVLGPLLDGVRSTGRSYRGDDHPFLLDRHGFVEQTYFNVSYDPIRGDDGSVGGVYCIVNETTGRVLGERRLRALAELGAELSDMGSAVELGRATAGVLGRHREDVPFALIYLADENGRLNLAGSTGTAPAAVGDSAELLARATVDAASATVDVADLLDPPPVDAADQALVLPLMASNHRVGALVVGVARQLPLNDDYRNFLELVAAQISRAVGTQRAYEHERARAVELAALDLAKTNFFANVSHEFRTPLTLVLGPLEDMLADPALPADETDRLTMMHRNALRLLKLVNTVLDFSRLESGRLAARYQPTDLAGYTARLASTFRSATDRAGLRLVVDCPPLPAPVFVDRDMWEKIVLNLVSNAVKFTFDGEIRVRVRAVDGVARLEVTDTGIGIVPDELPYVFERFHRVPGVRARTHEGTGIGLALVRELVEMHGGEVGLTSQVDEGSTFTVTVPFGSAHLPTDRVAAFGPLPADEPEQARLYVAETALWTGVEPAPEFDGRSMKGVPAGRILVVDDNVDLREHVTRLLSPTWEVVTASDGLVALQLAREGGFDLVLTDVMMPRLDGFGLVSALRADPRTRHVPIVMLSARAGSAEAVAGLAAGADDYLTKPFSGQELIARVRANVELGQLRGQIIRRLRALADAAVAVNTARSTGDVLQVAARHALSLAEAARVVVTASGARSEADGGGATATDPSFVAELTGTTGDALGEMRVWRPAGDDAQADEAALTQLARLVGVRLENAQLYEAEHRIATTLQHSLLPRSLPQLPGAVLASRYLPGSADVEVGGDWYDAIVLSDDDLVLVIGDVVGKGVQAAAAMGQLRNALRAYLLEGYDPGESLTRLNRLVGSTEHGSFATVVCLLFNPRTGRLRYASAGHPSPLLITGGDVAFLHDRALGPPIGAIPGATYEAVEGELAAGSRLLLYTDGLIEDRQVGIDVALAQLRVDAATPGEHVADLIDAVVERIDARPRRDDVALLALEAAELNRFALRLPADPTRLSVLRKRLEDFLVAHAVDETDVFDLTVAVSEAAANAIEHPVHPAEAVISVEVAIEDRTVTATVRDSGQWRESTGAGFRGRGLALIRALGDLTVQRTDEGTEVTLRRQLRG
ncbi:signal transduction histidine kinase/serine phosphatase RsbU (regulator of sigma subunit)/DNA-binding response OmpR family regulator [Micromonospora luteifusca]|uniref:histidine kinase n=1 Tax=Micromonospora luteifusca TaxID=709860 RepID=A0ABS2LXX1_9ACTN|nr:SpoIIE family protein phosphatase [Micromonospora luteifusca]MBM7493046.1 signal transduction histidine kinase/serine phosphatase RsbU (regulator of sigma subunit)/DNA-binding response OmpR family regulator [Micromonospora luteifusca]